MSEVIIIAGSRYPSLEQYGHIAEILAPIMQYLPCKILVGDAIGTDAYTISLAIGNNRAKDLMVFTILDHNFNGGWNSTARKEVTAASMLGAEIVYVVLDKRKHRVYKLDEHLRERTMQMLRVARDMQKKGDRVTLVAWPGYTSAGTWLTISEARKLGIGTVVYRESNQAPWGRN